MAVIKINIESIENLGDIERFFTLLCQAGVLFHPEMSFRDHVELDENRDIIGSAFSEEEADRLDGLMDKCFEVAEEVDANIFKIGIRVTESYMGKIELKEK